MVLAFGFWVLDCQSMVGLNPGGSVSVCAGVTFPPSGRNGEKLDKNPEEGEREGERKTEERRRKEQEQIKGLCTPQKDGTQHWGQGHSPQEQIMAKGLTGNHSRHDPAPCPCQRGQQHQSCSSGHPHAVLLCVLGAVSAVEELPLEELHGNDGEDEHEELVDDEDVEDVLERCHHAVKNSLRERAELTLGNPRPWQRAGPTPGCLWGKKRAFFFFSQAKSSFVNEVNTQSTHSTRVGT